MTSIFSQISGQRRPPGLGPDEEAGGSRQGAGSGYSSKVQQRTTLHATESSGQQRPDHVLLVADRYEGLVEERTVVAMVYRDFPIDVTVTGMPDADWRLARRSGLIRCFVAGDPHTAYCELLDQIEQPPSPGVHRCCG